ncbi:XRE family transcriptional regulator [Thiohalocapsa halophila]|uniref:XRE family transcriptional regulator n=1 Tax=Thiohalocapsa halophila TaxID=69359 RepID=A0ABS1CHQ6_9GAMM|nr:MbcA/ParS/Xre antitoxin family protein [Thiohalocapsa halophila]MBK1631405.1 XRE family transcriptional regulator [Thiohalocapsa halophila]
MPTAAQAATATPPDPRQVLTKALLNAGKGLGLSQQQLADIVGRERTIFSRGLDPDSKSGELGLLLIRCYRSLYALAGGDGTAMRHWMHTQNLDTGGVPAQQVCSVQGLVAVVEYLDAMRGHA